MTYVDTKLFIDGAWRDAARSTFLQVVNPATGKEIGHVAKAGAADICDAAEAALRGFHVWKEMPPITRAKVMRAATANLRERASDIARLMTQEQGKPIREALGETLAAADIIEWFADEGLRVYGRTVPSRQDAAIRQIVQRDPVGPVAAFSPWNFPLNQIARKIGPALAAGCSVVLKAPEETPASPAALVQAFADAGLPAGVLNLIFGDPAQISSALIAHTAIRKVTFTGSTAVGKQLAALAGQHMKRVSMELGGHAPVIICKDADIEQAIKVLSAAKFRNAGQVCIAPTRFLVHESLSARFAEGMTSAAKGIRVGNGLEDETQMGPLANPRRVIAMEGLTEDAVALGARLLFGGKRGGDAGNGWMPTVLDAVPTRARIMNEEPFGPIVAIRSFSTLDEAITEANRLPFGLAGYAFTRSLRYADQISRKVQVGMMWINMPAAPTAEMPFGGLQDSGYGSEGGPEALDCYLNVRSIAINNA